MRRSFRRMLRVSSQDTARASSLRYCTERLLMGGYAVLCPELFEQQIDSNRVNGQREICDFFHRNRWSNG